MKTIPFLSVGNHPCLDFINTELVVDGQRVDLLTTDDDVIAWAVQARLVTQTEADAVERHLGKEAKAADMLEQIRAFRAALRDMIERIAAGKAVPQTAVQAINDALRARVGYPQVVSRKEKFERSYQIEREGGGALAGSARGVGG